MKTPEQFLEGLKEWTSSIIAIVDADINQGTSNKEYALGWKAMAGWIIAKIEHFEEEQKEGRYEQ